MRFIQEGSTYCEMLFEANLPLKHLGKAIFLFPKFTCSMSFHLPKRKKKNRERLLTVETTGFPVKLGPSRAAPVHSLIILPVHLSVRGVVRCPGKVTKTFILSVILPMTDSCPFENVMCSNRSRGGGGQSHDLIKWLLLSKVSQTFKQGAACEPGRLDFKELRPSLYFGTPLIAPQSLHMVLFTASNCGLGRPSKQPLTLQE